MPELSLDHYVPRSKGGELSWTNTVTACLQCNSRKGNLLPHELPAIGMRLISKPYVPTITEIQNKARKYKNISDYHPDWIIFL